MVDRDTLVMRAAAAVAVALIAPAAWPQSKSPAVRQPDHHDVSLPLREIPAAPRKPGPPREAPEPGRLPPPQGSSAPDAVTQTWNGPLAMPSTSHDFEGVGQGFTGPQGTFTVRGAPPDTDGDIGPNHYVQIVNTDFAIFSRTGTVLYGPVPTNTLWSGFGGGCQTNNDGDAVVKYDKHADRWVFSQFSVSTTPYRECLAVSQTGDPTGAYNRYSYTFTDFPDYPKLAVWSDGYYVTYNMFNPNSTFSGSRVCAFERDKMLTGALARQLCAQTSNSYGSSLPSDLDGPSNPPAGAANYTVSFGTNSLLIWKAHVDWGNPASSTLTGPATLSTAAFSAACGGGTCVPQPNTNNKLDSLADRLMYRLGYRNFGDHESLVVNHSVTPSGSGVGVAGVRWYEVRSPGSSPSIFQQGTYAPADGGSRWMGSIAMDGSGDIAMGYSVSSGSILPSIRYTGRLVGDPPGTMPQGEATIQAGGGSQTTAPGGPLHRWGDYSSISVDPADDCTFWYTNEYLAADGAFNWQTRIGSFRFPSCGCTTTPTAVASGSATICAGQSTPLSGSGGVSCSWSPTTGLSNASSCSPTASPSSTTTYTLTVTDAGGCSSTNDPSATVTVNPKPSPTITPSGPTTFCQGGSVTLDAGAGYSSYLWSPGGATTRTVNVASSGSYSVDVTNSSGCSTTSSPVTVTVNPLPTAVASGSATICAAQSTPLSGSGTGGTGPYSCSWSPSTGLSSASSCAPSASPSSTTTYFLTVSDSHGCHSANAASATVTVVACSVLPRVLAVDPSANGISSDGNGVLEPGETVSIQPSWKNVGSSSLAVTGSASNFTGGAAATYAIGDAAASYGTILAGQTSSCASGSPNCYTLSVSSPASRPTHWDATFLETLSNGETKTWTLHIGDSFSGDVSRSNVFYQAIETIFHNNITLGCGVSQFCPTNSTRRDEMAAFIARSLEGSDAAVPVSGTGYDCAGSTSNFADVPAGSTFCRHANLLFVDGITIGCGGGNFCPADQILRRDAAVLVARAMNVKAALPAEPVPNFGTDGGTRSYNCDTVNDHDGIPAGTSPFPDVLATDVFCPHVGFLWVNHVVNGDTNGNFRPGDQIRRDEMATMLSHAFVSLPLYGP